MSEIIESNDSIIDGWEKKPGVKVSSKSPFIFPNSGTEISRDCSMGNFCVALTKEVIAMLSNGVGFDTCMDCAYEWAGEWGGFIGSEKVLAYILISNKPVFILEDMSDLPDNNAMRIVYRYWLRHNEWRADKKEQLLRDWNAGGKVEFPSMMELLDRIEAGGRWER